MTGKTELIFRLAKNQRAIVAFPYVSQVIQQQEKQANFQFLYDSEKIRLSISSKIFAAHMIS